MLLKTYFFVSLLLIHFIIHSWISTKLMEVLSGGIQNMEGLSGGIQNNRNYLSGGI
jgi:hypothetical protein